MFYRNKKTRKYQAPVALATHMALESNFCQTVRFKIMLDVDPLENMMNIEDPTAPSAEYFEDIVS